MISADRSTQARQRSHLRQVETGAFAAVVVVAVHVEDLLALDRQEAGEDTFGKTGTENDDLRDGH